MLMFVGDPEQIVLCSRDSKVRLVRYRHGFFFLAEIVYLEYAYSYCSLYLVTEWVVIIFDGFYKF